ncbi:hypothetical protein [Chryseolinea lacunae]|uniref:DUF4386 domain-containing protein n=1 Tax=Chryseolinea lacunae TaxID=2801331 RepID=A0ABS1L1Q9_9BACT|nr:hypothetical protein [Chryseolinea lacunae]MBL0745472.1 hypothetical protein [Chryseolinea lacunae]
METTPEQEAVTTPEVTEAPANQDIIQMNIDETAARVRKASYWFFAIAVFSVINSFMIAKGSYFVLGLGITQFIDGMFLELTGETNLIASFIPSLLFVLFGIFAMRLKPWAFIVGGILYALDGVLFAFFEEWMAFAFHGLALFGLYKGLMAIKEHRALVQNATA